MRTPWIAIGAAALLLTLAACSNPTSPSSGRVNVLLTDAPLDLSTVKEVRVTLEEILLFERDTDDDQDGMAMTRPGVSVGQGLTVNLLDFQNGTTTLVATLDAPAGDYQKLRLRVSQAELVREDPGDPMAEIVDPIFLASQKVDVPAPFSVTGGETTDVTLDFDASRSVQVNETSGVPTYILRPVITPVGVK